MYNVRVRTCTRVHIDGSKIMTKTERKKLQAYARQSVIECLEKYGSASDKKILACAVDGYPLTSVEKKDNTPNGKRNTIRSLTGTAIATLKKEGAIAEECGEYYLVKEKPVIVREEVCEKELLILLSKSSMSKTELFQKMEEKTGTSKTATRIDDTQLRTICGSVLKRLLGDGEISLAGGKYSLVGKNVAVYDENGVDLQKAFLKKLHGLGGAFFERFFMNLLDVYYRTSGKTVKNCQVVGGSADGGIDGIIQTVDGLGFQETIMVQTKCRAENHVTEKEVREFYGAVCAQNGSRGIYATTSIFHRGAKEFLFKIDNCVGVDGERVFSLAKQCGYGLKKTKNGYILDETAFF